MSRAVDCCGDARIHVNYMYIHQLKLSTGALMPQNISKYLDKK